MDKKTNELSKRIIETISKSDIKSPNLVFVISKMVDEHLKNTYKLKTLMRFKRALEMISALYTDTSLDTIKDSRELTFDEKYAQQVARMALGAPNNLTYKEFVADRSQGLAEFLTEDEE